METVWHESGRSEILDGSELRHAALGMLDARRSMRGFLPASLIHDVALEMLLTLYVALPGRIPLAGLLEDMTVPDSTAQRWFNALAAEKLVTLDGPQALLTPEGHSRMSAMISRIVTSQRELNGWAEH